MLFKFHFIRSIVEKIDWWYFFQEYFSSLKFEIRIKEKENNARNEFQSKLEQDIRIRLEDENRITCVSETSHILLCRLLTQTNRHLQLKKKTHVVFFIIDQSHSSRSSLLKFVFCFNRKRCTRALHLHQDKTNDKRWCSSLNEDFLSHFYNRQSFTHH